MINIFKFCEMSCVVGLFQLINMNFKNLFGALWSSGYFFNVIMIFQKRDEKMTRRQRREKQRQQPKTTTLSYTSLLGPFRCPKTLLIDLGLSVHHSRSRLFDNFCYCASSHCWEVDSRRAKNFFI